MHDRINFIGTLNDTQNYMQIFNFHDTRFRVDKGLFGDAKHKEY